MSGMSSAELGRSKTLATGTGRESAPGGCIDAKNAVAESCETPSVSGQNGVRNVGFSQESMQKLTTPQAEGYPVGSPLRLAPVR
jgi:hypothetical protein